MRKRSLELELMDMGPTHYTSNEYEDCLRKLGAIGTLFGGDSATLSFMKKFKFMPNSILDVGCGGGSFTIKLAHKYPKARVVGIDIDAQALEVARQQKRDYEKKHNIQLNNLIFEHRTNATLQEPLKSFDVVIATLLCHHLSDNDIVQFLRSTYAIARKAVIINDLHRNWFAYFAFWLISPFFKNRMIRYDGLLSIKRAFRKKELISYLHQAGLSQSKWQVTWRWAFRWIITIDCTP